MEKKSFVLKGNIVYSGENKELCSIEGGYVVCENSICRGAFEKLPKQYETLPLTDYGDKIILPGMTDLHVHAPQYTFRALGMDLELLDWLNVHTFPEEAKYVDISYAKRAYGSFVSDLKHSLTTRACIFATLHREATVALMDLLEESGIVSYVGKVNMDRNGGENLCEADASAAAEDTKKWIEETAGKYERTNPILTPRFIPSCTDELMRELAKLQKTTGLRVQSHLSENPSEVAWVKELVPAAKNYADAYAVFDMFGDKDHPAVMAHCIYSEDEMDLLKEHGVYVAHCPESNLNLSSGIAPVRKFLEEGVAVGLGSDVAGGSSLSMAKALTLAVQVSKMYWRLIDEKSKPLTFAEAFYLATAGGGSYFGKVGTFLDGYEFDAVVAEDHIAKDVREYTPIQRTERMMYDESTMTICAKYAAGCACEL